MVTATAPLTFRPMARTMPRISRNIIIVTSVLLLHVLVLWAMQTGLLRRVAQVIVPAEILVVIMPSPAVTPAPAPEPAPKLPAKVPAKTPSRQTVQPSPAPPTLLQSTEAPLSPPAMAPTATAPVATSAATTASPTVNTPASPVKLELPSSNADYLNNPKPPYPALSKRLGEQGTSVVHVLIGVDGTASQASIKRSSGFDRLDQAAVRTALQWRYVPGKRAGVPEAMWFDIPFNWILN